MHLFDAALCAAIEHSLDRAMSDLACVTQPALIHCDFHYENVLHVDRRLSGLLDFEWALAGDPAYDFSIAHVRERMLPGSEATLIAGYQSVRPFDPGHERRLRCYEMIRQLERVVARQRLGDSTSAGILVKRLRQFVESLDPAGQR